MTWRGTRTGWMCTSGGGEARSRWMRLSRAIYTPCVASATSSGRKLKACPETERSKRPNSPDSEEQSDERPHPPPDGVVRDQHLATSELVVIVFHPLRTGTLL